MGEGGGSLDCEQHLAESRLIRIQLQEQKSLQNERDLYYGNSGLEVKVLRQRWDLHNLRTGSPNAELKM